ncbi:ABC transporter ATP-binding protein/permease [Streptomyces sp. NBC_00378]|uniref:ABC transporter ATP-binding protein n=1 Tax=unclassified Streptomyces TaxID=2593676 RepID=UPI0022583D6A|nr:MULTISPECIES: ABC transporter ATP-binding protein [unclassified Streptomyces]MCX5109640.1 ABC transporter ATP-binding protein/permease [Streptomyces sp. NBC_00378]
MSGQPASRPAEFLRGLTAVLALTLRSCPGALAVRVATVVIAGTAPVAASWLLKYVVDSLAADGFRAADLNRAAVGIGLLTVLLAAASALSSYADGRIRRATSTRAQSDLLTAVNRLSGLSRLEQPAFHDRVQLAIQSAQGAERLVGAVLQGAQGGLTLVGFLGSVLLISPTLAAILVAAAVPALFAHLANSRHRADMFWRTSSLARRQIFYRGLLTDTQAAKEIRLYGLGDYFAQRLRTDLDSINQQEEHLDRRLVTYETALAALGAAVSTGALVWGVHQAATHVLTAGDVSLLVAALAGLQTALVGLVGSIAQSHQTALLFGHYLHVTQVRDDLPAPPAPIAPPPLSRGIELRDVWFRYADDGPWILRGVSLTIAHGTSLAVVGLNGAGKSTLVKLLCRLYDPQRGSIHWDGIDLKDLPADQLRRRVSVVFQDPMEYDLTAGENIGLGDLGSLHDHGRIHAAAADADIHTALAGLPQGYDTMLSRMFFPDDTEETNSGVQLSGGQWQRLALARALMRSERDLMILDEPSTGLDAVAERHVHDRLAALREGATSILVSHRLNTVRAADTIVVIADGTVRETGTHEQLMTARGMYAELFTTQAEGYEETVR